MIIKDILQQLNNKGVSDTTIAIKVGMNQSDIWRIRNGQRKDTSYENGVKIKRYADSIINT